MVGAFISDRNSLFSVFRNLCAWKFLCWFSFYTWIQFHPRVLRSNLIKLGKKKKKLFWEKVLKPEGFSVSDLRTNWFPADTLAICNQSFLKGNSIDFKHQSWFVSILQRCCMWVNKNIQRLFTEKYACSNVSRINEHMTSYTFRLSHTVYNLLCFNTIISKLCEFKYQLKTKATWLAFSVFRLRF